MPGERADVIIDFTDWNGYTNIVMTNSFHPDSFATPGFAPVNVVGGAFLQFRVVKQLSGTDTSTIPQVILTNVITAQQLASNAVRVRRITLDLELETRCDSTEPSPHREHHQLPKAPFAESAARSHCRGDHP
jgi:hypothetical protein